ncbi:MAG: hypothetical protein CMJ18_26335 [Phycisphaeraceae bacterium]|nr:hypothetical protein [Phycisphaeraceae bacterium]
MTRVTHLTNAGRIRTLPWALAGQDCTSIYVHLVMAGPIFLLFLDSLGLEQSEIGLAMSIIPFMGVLSLAASPVARRAGYKRTFLAMWTLRTLVLASLVLLPTVLERRGASTAYVVLLIVLTVFGVLNRVLDRETEEARDEAQYLMQKAVRRLSTEPRRATARIDRVFAAAREGDCAAAAKGFRMVADSIPEDRLTPAARTALDVALEGYGRSVSRPNREFGFLAIHAVLANA